MRLTLMVIAIRSRQHCGRAFTAGQTVYSCPPCDLDFCVECSRALQMSVRRPCQSCGEGMEVQTEGGELLTCDGECHRRMAPNEMYWSCAKCDFDLCEPCSGKLCNDRLQGNAHSPQQHAAPQQRAPPSSRALGPK